MTMSPGHPCALYLLPVFMRCLDHSTQVVVQIIPKHCYSVPVYSEQEETVYYVRTYVGAYAHMRVRAVNKTACKVTCVALYCLRFYYD